MSSTHLLQEWALSHGATLHENVEVHQDESGSCSLRTREQSNGITSKGGVDERVIVSCPLELSLSAFNAFPDCPLSRFHLQDDHRPFPAKFLKEADFRVIGIFFLCEQYLLLEQSFWYPYISCLLSPADIKTRVGTPTYWTPDDMRWIAGTNLKTTHIQRTRDWEDEWRRGVALLNSEGFPETSSYTLKLYIWAATIYSSRSFVSSVLPLHTLQAVEELPAPKHDVEANTRGEFKAKEQWNKIVLREHKSTQILFPLVDLANHDPQAKVVWRVDKTSGPVTNHSTPGTASSNNGHDCFKIIAEKNIPPNQEVFNNYGSTKSNSELLLGYGFCLPDPKNDYFSVDIDIQNLPSEGHSVLTKQDCYRPKATITSSNTSSSKTLIPYRFGFNVRPSAGKPTDFPPPEFRMIEHGFLDMLALRLANESEMAYLRFHPSQCVDSALFNGPLARLLLDAISITADKLRTHRDEIRRNEINLTAAESMAQRNAEIYRSGQLLILDHALAALEDRLRKAYVHHREIRGMLLPPVTLWTISEAYERELLGSWLSKEELRKPQYHLLHTIYQAARTTLELDPHETIYGPSVLAAGWEKTVWMLWLCIGSIINQLCPAVAEDSDSLRWVAGMETKYHLTSSEAASSRRFIGVEDERKALMDILVKGSGLGGMDVHVLRAGERISWASLVLYENCITVDRFWRGGKEGGVEVVVVVEEEARQIVLCITRL